MVWNEEMVENYFERNPDAKFEEDLTKRSPLKKFQVLATPPTVFDDFDTEDGLDEDFDY
jgi:hypothetical protein